MIFAAAVFASNICRHVEVVCARIHAAHKRHDARGGVVDGCILVEIQRAGIGAAIYVVHARAAVDI